MSNTIKNCPSCGCQSLHLHKHDTADGYHIHGTERFECSRCGKPTFAHDPSAGRFAFFNDAPERQAAFSHAMVRP